MTKKYSSHMSSYLRARPLTVAPHTTVRLLFPSSHVILIYFHHQDDYSFKQKFTAFKDKYEDSYTTFTFEPSYGESYNREAFYQESKSKNKNSYQFRHEYKDIYVNS